MIAGTSSGAGKTNAPDGVSAKVSIVMPAYNTGPFIGAAIQSVLDQTYPNWELIIVDDGSVDDTLSNARLFADTRITAVSQPNDGPTSARNLGLSRVSGDWVMFLDSDDLLLPDALQALIEAAVSCRHDVRPAAVYGDYTRITEDGARFGYRDRIAKLRRRPSGDLARFMLQGFVSMMGTAIIRRDVATRVGYLQGHLEPLEDWVWFAFAALYGPFVNLGKVTMKYRLRKSSLSMTAGLDMGLYAPALDEVFGSDAVRRRFSEQDLRALRAMREATILNFIAAQHVRHQNYSAAVGAFMAGLRRSVRKAPGGARMIALAAFGF
jgi:glycosyltransferase involved in cell wall biosynthesis